MIDASRTLGTQTLSPFFASQARRALDNAIRVVSVGIPLGWDSQDDLPEEVTKLYNSAGSGGSNEDGGVSTPLVPHALISLGVPLVDFQGRHYLTGRFMSNSLKGLRMPRYEGTDQFVYLSDVSSRSLNYVLVSYECVWLEDREGDMGGLCCSSCCYYCVAVCCRTSPRTRGYHPVKAGVVHQVPPPPVGCHVRPWPRRRSWPTPC